MTFLSLNYLNAIPQECLLKGNVCKLSIAPHFSQLRSSLIYSCTGSYITVLVQFPRYLMEFSSPSLPGCVLFWTGEHDDRKVIASAPEILNTCPIDSVLHGLLFFFFFRLQFTATNPSLLLVKLFSGKFILTRSRNRVVIEWEG